VVGVSDERTGEAVKAYVVVEGQVRVGELKQHVSERLARFKQPTVIELVAALPHSLSGEVARARIEDAR
jgi:long-chain acyl-CoA synthetase